MSRFRLFGPTLLCALALLCFGAAAADAAVRYAGPGGNGPSPCPVADPCSLYDAASFEAPIADHATDGDEVVVLPGTYSGTGDLGPEERLSLPTNAEIHGAAGQSRPVILFAAKNSGLILNGWDIASDLELIGPQVWTPLHISQSVAERLVVKSSKEQGIACQMGFRSVLRDSVCIAEGTRAAAAGQRVGTNPFPMNTRTLRNVTAIGIGPESKGISFDISGGEVFVDVMATIAQGTATDVEAIGAEPAGGSTITLSASDYTTTSAVPKDGGVALVTAPGTEGNITAPPLLAGDLFHQLPGSPTINSGLVDDWSGSADVDGDARIFEGQPDIGADETAPPDPPTISPPPLNRDAGTATGAGVPPPTSANRHPETNLTRKPPAQTRHRKATFAFASTEPNSTFECKVDSKPYRPCHSPLKVRVSKRRHVFRVRALAAGLADPTPVAFYWRVLD